MMQILQQKAKRQKVSAGLIPAMLTLVMLLGTMGAWGQEWEHQDFSSSNSNWSIPAGTTKITVEAIGGGGKGGDGNCPGYFWGSPKYSVGGGGGGGGYARLQNYPISSGSLEIVVGGQGGESSVKVKDGSVLVKAGGGAAGGSGNNSAGAGGPGGGYDGYSGFDGASGSRGDDASYRASESFSYHADDNKSGKGGTCGKISGSNPNGGDLICNQYSGTGGSARIGSSGWGGGYGGNAYGGGGSGARIQRAGGETSCSSSSGGSGHQGFVRVWYYRAVNITFNANMPQIDVNMNDSIPGSTTISYGSTFGNKLNWRGPNGRYERRGYNFTGWNTKADGTGTTVTSSTTSTFTTDQVLYAQWQAKTMTVTFNLNGGNWASGHSNSSGQTAGPYSIVYGKKYKDQISFDWTIPVLSGYTFMGWKTSNSYTATGQYYGPDAMVGLENNHTLYAVWIKDENLPTTVCVCPNGSAQLCAPSYFSGYIWTPTTGLSSSTGQCVTVSGANVANPPVYTVTYAQGHLENWDFSAGNTGFSSDYDILPDDPNSNGELRPERRVSATDCWGHVHPSLDQECTLIESYEGDKASGGKFLAVNGGSVIDAVVYEQTVKVERNTEYDLSIMCALAGSNQSSPIPQTPRLLFFVNGSKVSTDTMYVLSSSWNEMSATWSSGNADFATIQVRDYTYTREGNDFALDHIMFEAQSGPGHDQFSVTVDVLPEVTSPTSITATKDALCLGESVTFTATGGTGDDASIIWSETGCPQVAYMNDFHEFNYSTANSSGASVNSDGNLVITSTSNDPMIPMRNLGTFNPNAYKYFQMRYKVVSAGSEGAGSAELFFYGSTAGHTDAVGHYSTTAPLINDGNWHVATFNTANSGQSGAWTSIGDIKGWRFDYCNKPGVTMEIDYIALTNASATGSTYALNTPAAGSHTVYADLLAGCKTGSCVQKTITVVEESAPANAGADGIICGREGKLWASGVLVNDTAITKTWSCSNPNVTFEDVHSPNTKVYLDNSVELPAAITFTWSYTGGACGNSSDDVVVTFRDCDPDVCFENGTVVFRDDFGGNDPADPVISLTGLTSEHHTSLDLHTDTIRVPEGTQTRYGIYGLLKKGMKHGGWIRPSDHTYPDDYTRGYFMECDGYGGDTADVFYTYKVDGLCPNTLLYFSYWMICVNTNPDPTHAGTKLELQIKTLDGDTLATSVTDFFTDTVWTRQGLVFPVPDGVTSVVFYLINEAMTQSGNDFGLDDFEIRLCTPPATITEAATLHRVCAGENLTLHGSYTDDGTFLTPHYRWFKSTNGTDWTMIDGATDLTYTISNIQSSAYYYMAVAGSQTTADDPTSICRARTDELYVWVNNPEPKDDIYVHPLGNYNPLNLDVLTNDEYELENTISATVVTAPQHGSVAWDASAKKFVYTPASGYDGNDEFTYSLTVDGCTSLTNATVQIYSNELELECPTTASGNCYSFPNATFQGYANTLSIAFGENPDGGYITLPANLPAGVEVSYTYSDQNNTLVASAFISKEGGLTEAEVQSIVQGTQFCLPNADMVKNITVMVDGSATPAQVFYYPENDHYYMYMKFESAEDANLNWFDCYRKAKSMNYLGRQGYLATVTDGGENQFLTHICNTIAWLGGTRIAHGAQEGTMYYATFDENPDHMLSADTTTYSSTHWYWACGPERGQMIFPYARAPYNGNSDETSVNEKRAAYHALSQQYGYYSNWKIAPAAEPNLSTNDNEACLTLLSNDAPSEWPDDGFNWNDRCYDGNVLQGNNPSGYAVEFGNMTDGHSGADDESNLITVVATVGGFDAGEIDDQGQTICQGDAVTEIGNEREAKGGQGDITYKWQVNDVDITGANGATYTPEETTPGVYTYTRWAKADECETTWEKSTGTWVLTINPILTAPTTLSYDADICATTTGASVTITATGGTGTDADIRWSTTSCADVTSTSPSGATFTLTKAPGTYTVYADRLSGCHTGTCKSVQIIIPEPLTITQVDTTTSAKCKGDANGEFKFRVSGGTPNYTVSVKKGAAYVPATQISYSGSTYTVSGLEAGTYAVTVTDAHNCTATGTTSYTVKEPAAALEVTNIIATPENCTPANDGTATVEVQGGNGGYTFTWSGENGNYSYIGNPARNMHSPRTDNTVTPPVTYDGEYTVVVRDSKGCSVTESVEIELNNILAMNSILCPDNCITVCSGNEFVIEPVNGTNGNIPDGTQYTWTTPTTESCVTGGSANAMPKPIITDTLYSNCQDPSIASYPVTPQYGICRGNPVTVSVIVQVNVNPGITLDMPNELRKCSNAPAFNIPVSFPTSLTDYTVTWKRRVGTDETTDQVVATHNHTHSASGDTCQLSIDLADDVCKASYTYFVEYSGTDGTQGCIASDACVVTVDAGTWTLPTDGEETVECISAATPLALDLTASPVVLDSRFPTVTDGCGRTLNPVFVSKELQPTSFSCKGKIIYTYRYTACDNSYKDWTYTYNIEDKTKPVVNVTGFSGQIAANIDQTKCEFTIPDLRDTVRKMSNDNCIATNNLTISQDKTAGTVITAATQVSVHVIDSCGNDSTIVITVTVPTLPTITEITSTDVTCHGGSNGTATVTPANGTAPYTYAWSNAKTTNPAENLAAGNYKVTVTDANGCTVESTFVTVTQPDALSISGCLSNITKNTDTGKEFATVNLTMPTFSPTGNDAHLVITYSPATPTNATTTNASGQYPIGTTTVTIKAVNTCPVDATLNEEVSCTPFTVTVTDNEPPTYTRSCADIDNQQVDPNHGANEYIHGNDTWNVIATDNSGVPPTVTYTLEYLTDPTQTITVSDNTTLNGQAFPYGITKVTWTAADNANPANTVTCSYTVEVRDIDAPEITCKKNTDTTVVPNTTGNIYTFVGTENWGATATDNVGVDSIYYTLSGTTVSTVHKTSMTGQQFNYGTTLVTWTATDKAGNKATCSFNVVVNDVTPPEFVISCQNIEDNNTLSVNSDTHKNYYTHSGNSWDVTATDNSGFEPTLTWNLSNPQAPTDAVTTGNTTLSGAKFYLGKTTVTWTATDAVNNYVTCSYVVEVIDNEPPCIGCDPTNEDPTNPLNGVDCDDIAATITAGGEINTDLNQNYYTHTNSDWDITAWDNCGVLPTLTWSLNNAHAPSDAVTTGNTTLSGAKFYIGTTTVTWTATDTSGKTSTCTFTVTVKDKQSPCIDNCDPIPNPGPTCVSIGDPTKYSDLNKNYYTNTGTAWDVKGKDNSGVDPVMTWEITHQNGTVTNGGTSNTLNGVHFLIGKTTVTWTATDTSGNTATCSFLVTVLDTLPPCIGCHPDSLDPTDPTKGVDCADIAALIGDQKKPTDVDKNYYTHTNSDWDITAWDNCGVPPTLTWSLDNANAPSDAVTTGINTLNGAKFYIGETTVTWTATDTSGKSSTCTFTVKVKDTQIPTFTKDCAAIGNQSKETDPGENTYLHSGTEWDATATDNSGVPPTLTWSLVEPDGTNVDGATTTHPSSLNGVAFKIGVTNVTWTAMDNSENPATCSFTVTVTDNQNPEINCPNPSAADTVFCMSEVPAPYNSYAAFAAAGGEATDNDAINEATFGLKTQVVSTTSCPRTITRTYKIQDNSGNESTCDQVIVVNDTVKPVIASTVIDTKEADRTGCVYAYPDLTEIVRNGSTDNCTPTANLTITQNKTAGEEISRTADVQSLPVVVTVADSCGNSVTKTINITVPALLQASVATTDETCTGSDGTATLTVTGGTPFTTGTESFYLYSWDNGQTSNPATGLQEGDYSVVITDAHGCTLTKDPIHITLDNPYSSTLTTSYTRTICSGGTFEVEPADMPANTTYSWSAPTSTTLSGMTSGTDETSISNTLNNLVTTPQIITYEVDPKHGVCAGSHFSITVNVQVTVNPTVLSEVPSLVQICPGDNVDLTASLSQIYSNHTIKWYFNGNLMSTQTNIAAPTSGSETQTYAMNMSSYTSCDAEYPYSISYTDESGCETSANGTVRVRIPAWSITTPDGEGTAACLADVVAPHLISGFVMPTVTDGCNNTLTYGTPAVTQSGTNCNGTVTYTYTYTACDNSHHDWKYVYTVVDNVPPTINTGYQTTHEALVNNCTFTVPDLRDVVRPYVEDNCTMSSNQYVMTQNPAPNTIITLGAAEQNITVNVTATDLCTNTSLPAQLTVHAPAQVALTVVDANSQCYGEDDGYITYSVSGGKMPYQVDLYGNTSNFQQINDHNAHTFSNLKDGNYTIKVTDANGCLTYNESAISVQQISQDLTVTALSHSWTYDSHAHDTLFYDITFGTETYTGIASGASQTMANNDVVTATVAGTITEVGSQSNEVTSVTVTRGGETITCFYNQNLVPGTLTVTKAGSDKVTMTCPQVAADRTWVYDAQPHSVAVTATSTIVGTDVFTITYSEDGTNYNLTECPTITNVGTKHVWVKAHNDNYEDATCDFVMEITKAGPDKQNLECPNVADSNWVYDGNDHFAYATANPIGHETPTIEYSLDSTNWTTDAQSIKYVTESPKHVYVRSLHPNYEDAACGFDLVISPADDIHVHMNCPTAEGSTWMFDGTAHFVTVSATSDIVGTDEFEITYSTDGGTTWSATRPERIDAGETNVTVKAHNPNYEDATCTYTLIVTQKPVTIEVTATLPYNGWQQVVKYDGTVGYYDGQQVSYDSQIVNPDPQGNNQSVNAPVVTVTVTGLIDNDYLTGGEMVTSDYHVGQYTYNYAPTMALGLMAPVTGTLSMVTPFTSEKGIANYAVTYKLKADIVKRVLDLTADDASKTYDGTVLTNNGYTVTGGSVATTDNVASIMHTGEQLCVGTSAHGINGAMIKRNTEDVTDQYTITYNAGTLTVNNYTGLECPVAETVTLNYGECDITYVITGTPALADPTAIAAGKYSFINNIAFLNPLPAGDNDITWYLLDACGDTMTTCTQTVTVNYPTCPDAEDNEHHIYHSVRIGCDCWTVRNLESEKYADGTDIPDVMTYYAPMYYSDQAYNLATYGHLYTWDAAIKDGSVNAYGHVPGICPAGWYLPTKEQYEGLNAYGPDALRATSTLWVDGGGTNTTGFTGLPGGKYAGALDRYEDMTIKDYYWSTSNATGSITPAEVELTMNCLIVKDVPTSNSNGYSIRCIKEKE